MPKRTDIETEDEEMHPSKRRAHRSVVPAGNMVIDSAANFQREMMLRKNKEFEALNTAFAAAVRFAPPTVDADEDDHPNTNNMLRAAANEYLRMAALIELKYGGVPCQAVGMGSDEILQLGIGGDQKFNIPPTLIPCLGPDIRMVKAGGLHSLALSTGGVPYSWGNSDEGMLGRPANNDLQALTPLPIKGFVRNDGVKEDGQILQIAAGDMHNLFLSLSGTVYMCGMYKDAEGGKFSDINGVNGTPEGYNDRPVQVSQMAGKVLSIHAKGSFNAVLLEDFTVATWGFGNSGELARSADMTNPDEHGLYNIRKGFFYRGVLKPDGKGGTYTDYEPDPNIVKEQFLRPKAVHWATNPQLKRTVIAVGLGNYHILVAARDPGQFQAKLYTSGLNNHGQLGHGDFGDNTDRHALTLVKALEHEHIAQMAGGEHFSIVLSHDGKRLYSFGRADYGQLGIGFFEELGDFRATPMPVAFPKAITMTDIEAGERHAMAISDNHEVYTWGYNEQGPTGHPLVDGVDVYRPRLLNLMESIKDDKIVACHVHGISGGGQHSLMLMKRYIARRDA